jgi:ribonuclease P protein component
LLLIVDRNTVERQALSKERTTRGLCGLTITKKVGNAVTRNKIRRRLKAALRSLLFSAPTNWPSMVIIVFPKAATLGFGELYSDLAAVLRQAGLPL